MGGILGVGGKPEVGHTIHKEANYDVVSPTGHRNSKSTW